MASPPAAPGVRTFRAGSSRGRATGRGAGATGAGSDAAAGRLVAGAAGLGELDVELLFLLPRHDTWDRHICLQPQVGDDGTFAIGMEPNL